VRQYLITSALVLFGLAVGCYCVDKDTFLMLSRYIIACACYEDFDADEKRFRRWQLLDEEQAKQQTRTVPIGV